MPTLASNVQSSIDQFIEQVHLLSVAYFKEVLLVDPTIGFDDPKVKNLILKYYRHSFKNYPDDLEIADEEIDSLRRHIDDEYPGLRSYKHIAKKLTQLTPPLVDKLFTDYCNPENIEAYEETCHPIHNALRRAYKELFYISHQRDSILFHLEQFCYPRYPDPDDATDDITKQALDRLYALNRSLRSSDKWQYSEDQIDPWFDTPFYTRSLAQIIDNAELSEANLLRLRQHITTLVYKNKRHDIHSEKCQAILRKIGRVIPVLKGYDRYSEFARYIHQTETGEGTYFGENPSDNSDSDHEADFQARSEGDRGVDHAIAERFTSLAQRSAILQGGSRPRRPLRVKVGRPTPSRIFNLKSRTLIRHRRVHITAADRAKLERVNAVFKANGDLTTVKNDMKRFVVAQYRGVQYLTTSWSQPVRQAHRAAAEVRNPQFAAAIYATAGIALKDSFVAGISEEQEAQLLVLGRALKSKLLQMREEKGVWVDGFVSPNLAIGLQCLYTKKYDEFHRLLQDQPDELSPYLSSTANPFLSTGDTPYHALRYAYGIKPYAGHEDRRLRPRWRRDGRPERPYSGKVYASLHPLHDYGPDGPYHHVTLQWQGAINIDNLIISERESTFYGMIDPGRIIQQHIAKYPAFTGYKEVYHAKYGLDQDLYRAFDHAFKNSSPHSDARKNVKWLLGEWLCSFHEVKLIESMRRSARAQNKLLLYRDKDGGFSFLIPNDSPMRNNIPLATRTPILKVRRLRSSFEPPPGSSTIYRLSKSEQRAIQHGGRRLFDDLSSDSDSDESHSSTDSSELIGKMKVLEM